MYKIALSAVTVVAFAVGMILTFGTVGDSFAQDNMTTTDNQTAGMNATESANMTAAAGEISGVFPGGR